MWRRGTAGSVVAAVALGVGLGSCSTGERVGVAARAIGAQGGLPPGGVRVWPRPYGWQGDGGPPPSVYDLLHGGGPAGWVREVDGGTPQADLVEEKLGAIPPPQPPPPPGSTQKQTSCLWGDRSGVFLVTLFSPEGDDLTDGDGFAAVVAEVCSAFDPHAPAAPF